MESVPSGPSPASDADRRRADGVILSDPGSHGGKGLSVVTAHVEAFPGWGVRAVAYAVLLVAFAAPVSLEPGARTFAPGPDTRLYLWTIGWDLHALRTDPLGIFDANIFFPETKTLAYSEHLIGAAALALPLSFFTSNLALLLNFVLLASTLITALGCDRLARECGSSPRGAFLAGILGAFSGPRLGRLTQAHLATLHLVPWALAFAVRYLREGRRLDLLLTLGLFTLQATTSGHGGLFLALALTLVFGIALVLRHVRAGTLVRDVGAVGALILAANLPFVIPYYEVKQKVGLTRVLEDAEGYAPGAGAWISAPTRAQQALLSALPSLRRAADEANASLFPGFVFGALALAGFGRVLRGRRLDGATLMAGLAFAALWLTLGPAFGLYRLGYALIPGFDLIRVPSRFFLLAIPALAVLAALALDRIRRPTMAGGLLLVAALECIPVPWDAPRDPVEVPPIDVWVASQPHPFRLVELPVPRPDNSVRQARFHSEYMLHSAAHWQPMLNGYSSLVPPRLESLYAELFDFPTEKGLQALERLGVGYVVIHTDMYQPDRWAEKERELSQFGDRIILAQVAGEGRAYTLVRANSFAKTEPQQDEPPKQP